MLWIPITLVAAFVQTFRFMLQKRLRMDSLSTGGATYSRFFYSSPLIALCALAYFWWTGHGWPDLGPRFWPYAFFGGVTQIMATACLVTLFSFRNFTVGVTITKAEVIATAFFGFVVLGDSISALASLAILLGVVGVIFLSDPPKPKGRVLDLVWNKSAGFGLAAACLFSICAVLYRGAMQDVATSDVLVRSLFTLTIVILIQLSVMSIYLWIREPGQIRAVVQVWRIAIWVGILSLAGSIGWFTAFALTNAAYVKSVGQVEVILSVAISVFVFGEKITRREISGIAILLTSVVLLILLS